MYEKPRKGNPLGFVINQHFHTAYAISKFHNNDGKVEVFMKDTKEIVYCNSRAKKFSTKRNWDERAERGYMAEIESKFHGQIDNLVSFKNRDHKAISEYFVLWRLRYMFYLDRLLDAPIHGVEGEDLTKEQQEKLEIIGCGYVNENGDIPARQLTGGRIQVGVIALMETTFSDMKWGLLKAKKGQFICSDSYQKLCILPVSPKYVFAGNLNDEMLDYNEVGLVNKQSIESATNFYFSKNLQNCPVV